MHPFLEWLDRVLSAGESVQDAPPQLAPTELSAVEARLRVAFDCHRLDVAGPPLAFDSDVALRAATALARACWLLVGADEGDPVALALDVTPSPPAHLSVDLSLRFLPAVYRRARMRTPGGPLTAELERVLRAWPLSGVLADLDGTPTIPLDFGGHTGLQLLYAERLVTTGRAGWVPPVGSARAWVERVFAERKMPVPVEPPKEDTRV